jgi:hypothetical protein
VSFHAAADVMVLNLASLVKPPLGIQVYRVRLFLCHEAAKLGRLLSRRDR